MPLTDAQCKHLRRIGHDRNPIVLVGQGGISPNLVTELERALDDHELVKVRARVGDRDALTIYLAPAVQERILRAAGQAGDQFHRPA